MWGLEPIQLHDAYWRSQGIQCVRRGEDFVPQRGHDLFMLLEPGVCTVFMHRLLANAMNWNRAPLSRVRVTMPGDSYTEKAISDENDNLIKIDRDYNQSSKTSCRVLMTRRASVAQVWAKSMNRREAWTELRRFVEWSRTDHYSVEGYVSRSTEDDSDLELIHTLAENWVNPGLAIQGISELRPGVWGRPDTPIDGFRLLTAPVWIGRTRPDSSHVVAVGPEVIPDEDDPKTRRSPAVRLMDIDEIRKTEEVQVVENDHEISIYSMTKRVVDIAVSGSVLLLALPLLLLVMTVVVMNDGWPIFFGHVRQSRGGREFKCWKFRTMMRDAESMVGDLTAQNIADGPQVFIKNDPRITSIGRLLRRFHIDEIPQFWNVLVGDMSLVGPRPSPDKENQFCPAWREARLSVRPGITGLWQVERTRAPGMDFQEWIKYDIEYVNRANLWLDCRICFKTLYRMAKG